MCGAIIRAGEQHRPAIVTPCLDDHWSKEDELGSVGELSRVCSQMVLKCLYLARIGRLDFLKSVNNLLVLPPNGP